jgi:hypothetical protein
MLLFLLILGIIRIYTGWFIPYHTGGRQVSDKISFIEDNKEKVDIIFIGSSRIRRGIIPTQFDSLTFGRTTRKGISFNLGGPAATVGENLYLLRKYASSDAGSNLKIVMIEWTDGYLPGPDKFRTERARYWMDAQSLAEQVSLMKGYPGLTTALREGTMQYAFGAFLHRSLGLRRISNALMDTIKPDLTYKKSRGYHKVFDPHAPLITSKGYKPGIPLYDPKQAEKNALIARTIHQKKHLMAVSEDVELWVSLINKYAQRGIRLVLLVPPGPVNERQLALLRRLPDGHSIDLSDPLTYPGLYNTNLFYDFVHLNHEGAELLTKHLAESFLKLQGDKVGH